MEHLRNNHFVVSHHARIVSVTRTALAFDTLEQMREKFLEVIALLDRLGREGASLLVDTSEAPARNDPAFEEAFEPVRVRLLKGFKRVAVLVKTPVGKLQAERHVRKDRTAAQTFNDRALAEAWLSERDSAPPLSSPRR
ncbi:MAG: hypothetical protein U0414_08255 [Polyangiaceae bacterium]